MATALLTPPTGLYVTVFRNKIEIRWVKNPETNVKGYNVYNSTTSGGGISGYVKLNSILIEQYSSVSKDVIASTTVVTENGGQRTTTIQQTLQDTYIFMYSHENLTEEKTQYYVVTAVDDQGNESPYSIEISGIPLIISTQIVTEPLRTENDISLDYISTLLQREPKLDVKPGSVTRQLHIDPNSKEISAVYVRKDFTSRAQSLLTLRDLDDSNGDGISDPVSESTYKQLLKSAYFLTNDVDVQNMIDFQFDKIAGNYGIFRKPATVSSTYATFYTTLTPTADVTISLGEEVSTIPTETVPAIKFKTLSSGTMQFSQIERYFNPVTQRYELVLPIEAEVAGSVGNVNANTILNTTVAGMQVTNTAAAFGGTDEESNSNLADRAQLAFVGLDVGTAAGYKKTVTKVPEVTDVIIVDAGHPMMQRDYDDVRHKHVYGKVDIYIRGGIPTQQQDAIGFLFKQSIDETFQILSTTDMIIKSNNPAVTQTKPIFTVTEIKNVTKAKLYDITGNWTVFKNAIEMVKTTAVTMDLALGRMTFVNPLIFGDVITANYDYKKDSIDEVIINPALGGEVNFTLDFFPVIKHSYTIYKNATSLVENVDYTLVLINGFLQLAVGLAPGDILTATYKFKVSVANEIVISSASGGEIEALLANTNILESLVINSDGISLDLEETNVINQSVGMDVADVITSTFRYRDSDPILLLKQPVDSIISVIGSTSGTLTEGSNYVFHKIDDILLEGNSVKATRKIQILFSGGIPIGDLIAYTENVVMINNEYKELIQKGIDIESIIVRDNTTTYVKNSDYLLKAESGGKNIQIARSPSSTIPNGGTIIVSYQYGELLTITYNTNPLIQQVQDEIETVRHVTADVLVKQVLETKIDFAISAVIKKRSDEIAVSSDIRTAISNEVNKKRLGIGIAQSDIIRAIEEVNNVESVLVPLTKMVKANGTQINREPILTQFTVYQSNVVTSFTTGPNALLQKTLGSNAGDGFYAIFENDRPLILVTDQNTVDDAAGQGFISSNGEVIISTINSDSPDSHNYTVCYVVNGELGAKDIVITDLEYLAVGEMVISTAFAS